MMGITIYINGIGYWFENDEKLTQLLDENCDDATSDSTKDNSVKYDDEL